MIDYEAIQLTLRARLLTVVGLPTGRVFSNVREYTPIKGTPYIEEAFSPSTLTAKGFPASSALLDATGLYLVHWYGVDGTDTKPINDGATAVLAKFAPGTVLALTSGDKVRVRGDGTGPTVGEAIPDGRGWCVATITIPWRVRTRNAIAA